MHTRYYSGYIIGKHSGPGSKHPVRGGKIPFKPKGPLTTTKLCRICCKPDALLNALAHAGCSWQGDGGACALIFFLTCNELAAPGWTCTKHKPALRRTYRILLWAPPRLASAEDLPCLCAGTDRQTDRQTTPSGV